MYISIKIFIYHPQCIIIIYNYLPQNILSLLEYELLFDFISLIYSKRIWNIIDTK